MGISNRDRAAHGALILMAVFAFAWAVARAYVQSVVGDEAAAYFGFATGAHQWYPAAANHLLNEMIVQVFTSIFGLSPLTLRAGALIGAAIFIVSAYWLCRMISREWLIRLPLFSCLVYNPYVFDFFVASRGYGLALAFLLAAIAFSAWSQMEQRPILGCASASLCIGLSFTANFAFALADAALLLLIFLWAMRSGRISCAGERWRLIAASLSPALIVVILIPSSTLLDWPKGLLAIGTDSIRETILSAMKATLYQLNPHIVNPLLLARVSRLKRFLLPAFWAAVLFHITMARIDWGKLRTAENQWRAALSIITGGAAALALLLHWAAFVCFGLRLPLDRTAVFFAPLCTVMAGSAVAIPARSQAGTWSRRVAIGMLFVMAVYFASCMRLTYFREWQYIAEAKQAYFAAAYFNHTRCAQKVYSSWYYESALEFYRTVNPHERFSSFMIDVKYPVDRQLYVLNVIFDSDFIRTQRLTMVYHGETTDIGVFLSPSLAVPPERACDAALLP